MLTVILILVVAFLIYKKIGKQRLASFSFSTPTPEKKTQETSFSGETGGIVWQGVSRLWRNQQKSSTTFRYFRWSTRSVTLGSTRYVMIMSLPNAIKLNAPGSASGFLGGIINKLAEAALDMYVQAFFGAAYKPLINLSDGNVMNAGVKDDFFVITNTEDTARSFLETADQMIRKWKEQTSHFANEKAVDAFGILFAPEEMIVSVQTTLTSQEEVNRFADFASALAVAMQRTRTPA